MQRIEHVSTQKLRSPLAATAGGDATKTETTFDRVLVSIGRRPNSALPGLDKAGVTVSDKGFITVDSAMCTNIAGISAIGDVVGEPMLAHKPSHEAKVAVEAILGHKVAFEPQAIPAVVFTDPEVGGAVRPRAMLRSRAAGRSCQVPVGRARPRPGD